MTDARKVPEREFALKAKRQRPMTDYASVVETKRQARSDLAHGKLSRSDFEELTTAANWRLLKVNSNG